MGWNVLITIDLPKEEASKRKDLYEQLEEKGWSKVKNVTTTWEVNFSEESSSQEALATVEQDLEEAKEACDITRAPYAMQAGKREIKIGR